MTLGDVIKEYRTKHRISQREFAKMCGGVITASYISMLEKNLNPKTGKEIVPSINTFEVVSRIVGIPFDVLLGMMGDNSKVRLSDNDELDALRETLRRRPGMRTLFDAAKDASDEDLLRAVAIIEALKGK